MAGCGRSTSWTAWHRCHADPGCRSWAGDQRPATSRCRPALRLHLPHGGTKIGIWPQPEETMRLQGKVAIISGGAHGMGECEARLFAREGAAVVIADVIKEGEAVAADISAGQARARFIRCDVTSETDWQHVIAETLREFGRLDILVNNAGISGSSVGDHEDISGWKRLL